MYPYKYNYDIDDVVRLRYHLKPWYKVIWRGKHRGHDGQMDYIYRLENAYWDCYAEGELASIRDDVQYD